MFVFPLAIMAVMALQSVTSVTGLSCYKCTVRPPANPREPAKLCMNFNHSDVFKVNCPYSSFCMKKVSSLPLNGKDIVITKRDCAPQKDMQTVKKNGTMQWETNILEGLYEEGCRLVDNTQQGKINRGHVCYCRNNLCNGQAKTDPTMSADIMGIIFVYNAMKYVRSFE